MNVVLIFLGSLGTAFITRRLAGRAPLTAADVVAGVVGGLVGASMTQLLSLEGIEWGLGVPLLLACVLSMVLAARQRRPLPRS